jgi:hypothetical protein
MHKFSPFLAAVSLIMLASCTPPEVPPSYRRPPPPYSSDLNDPNGGMSDNLVDPPPPVQPPTATGGYPTARGTDNPDEVISPYEPYNVIDVAGFKSGQLARDPSNNKIFRIP